MTIDDRTIGRNVARLRTGMHQKDLADAMRKLGWRWNQGTVSQVESGERPLRLAEAEDLARVLHLSAGSVLARGEWEGRFADAWATAHEAYDVLSVAVGQYVAAQLALAIAADDDRVENEHRADVLEMLQETAEQVVRERRRHLQLEEVKPGSMVAALLDAYAKERQ